VSQDRRLYIVRGQAAHGVITHRCPTAEFALDSLKRFKRENMESIIVLDLDGVPLTLGELEIVSAQATLQKRSGLDDLA
jgi:hypothetical protein